MVENIKFLRLLFLKLERIKIKFVKNELGGDRLGLT